MIQVGVQGRGCEGGGDRAHVDALGGSGDGAGMVDGPGTNAGRLNPEVTQATIGMTTCVRGWTRMVRPPAKSPVTLTRREPCDPRP